MAENTAQLLTTFNFRVTLRESAGAEAGTSGTAEAPPSGGGAQLGEGSFAECSGLQIEMDVQALDEGGRNDGVIQQVGRGKYQPIVLKRGMFVDRDGVNGVVWDWIMGILEGRRPVRRYDGIVEVLDRTGAAEGRVLATWSFDRGLPSRVVGPTLDAKAGEIAMEELHIAHEGLRMVFDA